MKFMTSIGASRYGKTACAIAAGTMMLFGAALPAAQAASLTQAQIDAITALLASFNVSSDTITNVQSILSGTGSASVGSSGSSAGTESGASAVTGAMIGFLHKGDNGKRVCYLHALLASDPSVSVDITSSDVNGNCPFGSLTERALKQFQEKHSIEAAGFIGPRTLKAIEQELEDNAVGEENDASGHQHACAIIPPGHLVAPGWLRKHDDEKPVVPKCQKLPPGIENQLGNGENENEGNGGEEEDNGGTATTPDTTAPIISAVTAGNIGAHAATIAWETDEAATSKVYYAAGTLDFATATSVSSGDLTTAHSLNLSGLSATTTYQYAVVSADAAGNTATSSTSSFATTD